jgi:eukaryotic-like serine/threonine-protein kinase
MSPGDAEQRWLDGRYELGEIIGQGGMSTVYRSYDHRAGRAVAVKVFRAGPELADAHQRFRREVILLAGLRDPGIVTVFDADFDDVTTAYLVTELVDGPTLAHRICWAPLTEAQVIRLAAALARTLAYVHAHDIIHRDVKPSNILLPAVTDDPFAAPKLADFGIAIAAEAPRLTSANLTLGTPNYLSPEQLRGEALTPATDVYSLGLVLIEALTGRLASPGTGLDAAMARIEHPPAIPAVASAALHAVLTEMTATGAADRPRAEQVVHRLDRPDNSRTTQIPSHGATASLALPVRKPDGQITPPAHRRHRSHTVAPAAALIIAAVAGVAAFASGTSHQRPDPSNHAPGYTATTSGRSPTPRHTGTPGPPTPAPANAPRQGGAPSSAAGSTAPSRRPNMTSHQRPAPESSSTASKTSPSTIPTSPAPATLPSTSPSTSPSDPGSPSTPPPSPSTPPPASETSSPSTPPATISPTSGTP